MRGVALVPVASCTVLVAPDRLYLRLPDTKDLAPFAFQLPAAYAQYSELLSELGMRESPSPDALLSCLVATHRRAPGACMNPNDSLAVVREGQRNIGSLVAGSVCDRRFARIVFTWDFFCCLGISVYRMMYKRR